MRAGFAVQVLFVIILLVTFLYYSLLSPSEKEGFTGDATTAHKRFVSTQANTYNPVGIALIAGNNEGALGTSTADIMGTPGDNINHNLNPGKTGLFAAIAKCEAVTTTDCNAFDDPEFSKQCGICLDIGTNSTTKPATGGLVLLPKDKAYAQTSKKGNFLPDYKPTAGTCPPGKMVSSKAECLQRKRKAECEKNGSYDLKECAQCYSDTTYTIVNSDPSAGVIAGSGTIYIVGTGTLSYSETGFSSKSNITLSMSSPYKIQLEGPEATRVTLTVSANASGAPAIAGYLSGTTPSGQFSMDLYRIVLTDNVTGRKPRTTNPMDVNGNSVTIMNPGFGKNEMALVAPMPFTFVDPATEEGSMCKDSPFITKQSSAEFLSSDPCYKKGSGPGKFSLECLQSAFLSNGCMDSGTGYPKDTVKAAALMTKPDGSFGSLNDIATIVYNNAIAASTGVSANGTKLSVEDWSVASEFCTGKSLKSPCDADDKTNGPLSVDCLAYLWNNGDGKKGEDTYDFLSSASSLFQKNSSSRYCQTAGTMSPLTEAGQKNQTAIQHWQKEGGVENVKKQMKQIHEKANAAKLNDGSRGTFLEQCYGVKIAASPVAPPPRAVPVDIASPYVAAPVVAAPVVAAPVVAAPVPKPTPPPPPAKWWDTAKIGSNWKKGDGRSFNTITISNTGVIFATNTSDGIFRKDSVQAAWRQLSGALVQISAGQGTSVVGANRGKYIYRGDGNGGWVNIPGGASWTTAGVNTETWVVGTNRSEPYGGGFWVKDSSNSPNWRSVGGVAEIVSAGTGEVWCVNGGAGRIYRWNGSNWADIARPDGKFVHRVAVSPNGKRIVCVAGTLDTNGGSIYAWTGADWTAITGTLYNIAICDSMMVGLTRYGDFWYIPLPTNN